MLTLQDKVYLLGQIVDMQQKIESMVGGGSSSLRSLHGKLMQQYLDETATPLCPNCNWPNVDKVTGDKAR